jgi:hypothetical protein
VAHAVENELMAVDVVTEIVIDAAPERVAAYAGDPTNAPDWYVNIASVDWQTAPPVVVDLVPGERLVMRTAEGPFPMETTYRWQPHGDAATKMTLRNRGEPSGFAKIAAPIMVAAMRRANTQDLASLKRRLEHDQ